MFKFKAISLLFLIAFFSTQASMATHKQQPLTLTQKALRAGIFLSLIMSSLPIGVYGTINNSNNEFVNVPTHDASGNKFVNFPTQDVLYNSLIKIVPHHFIENTNILGIAKRRLVAIEVAIALELAILAYGQKFSHPEIKVILKSKQNSIIKTLFQKDKKAFDELVSILNDYNDSTWQGLDLEKTEGISS